MDAQQLKYLKHELRTPINHLVGYASLLLDETSDQGHVFLNAKAKTLHVLSNELAKIAEKSLSGTTEPLEWLNICELVRSMMPVISKISVELSSDWGGLFSADLNRLRVAVERLQQLLVSFTPDNLELGRRDER